MTELDEIRAQLGRLSDRAALQDLVNRYAMAVDDHDLEAVAGMYTADACFSRRGRVSAGRDAVLRSLEKSMRRYGPTIHTPHTLVITWDDADHARGAAADPALAAECIFTGALHPKPHDRMLFPLVVLVSLALLVGAGVLWRKFAGRAVDPRPVRMRRHALLSHRHHRIAGEHFWCAP